VTFPPPPLVGFLVLVPACDGFDEVGGSGFAPASSSSRAAKKLLADFNDFRVNEENA
jgi:hypothetical protein